MSNRRLFTPEQSKFFAEHTELSNQEMAEAMNEAFGTSYNREQMNRYRCRYKGCYEDPYSEYTNKVFTDEEREYFYTVNTGRESSNVAQLMSEHFGKKFTPRQIATYRKNHRAPSGVDRRFGHGQKMYRPPKGTHAPGCEKGWFQAGHMPHNHRPVGSERVNVDGYAEVKVAEPKTWKLKHRLIWEEANGPIPKNHCVVFLDGDRQNCSLENLVLISQVENAIMVHKGLHIDEPGLHELGIRTAKLISATRQAEREEEQ